MDTIKFNIKISKWANFYFFIQNLSEWHFSNRKDYNLFWRKTLGVFSTQEEDALKRFKKIHLQYPFGELYLGRQFFLEENPWVVLEQKLLKEDFINLKKIFSLLKEKFDNFYNQELFLLKKWQTTLQKKLNNKSLITAINATLSKLYATFLLSKDITIYLLPSTKNHTGGTGGIINDKSINLEISHFSLEKPNQVIGIIWHEVTHLYFEKQSFLLLVNKKYPNDPDAVNLIKEAANSSLFPNGVLGIKFLNTQRKLLSTKIPLEYTKKLVTLADIFIKENKSFDDEYIKKVYSLTYKLKGILK